MLTKTQNWLSLPLEERRQIISELVSGKSEEDFMNLVSAGDLGVFASLGPHFNYAVFGRDSLQVAEDLLQVNRPLVDKIILTMAKFQGTKTDARSEEEPGKIHHEYRSKVFAGQTIPETSLNVMRDLQRNWGDETADEMCYYGSYDATPLFIRLIGSYEKLYGPEFLNQTLDTKQGRKRLKDSVRAAADWLAAKIRDSEWHLFEYKRLNFESGIGNQSWKDSGTSYLHNNGDVANYDRGIASIELQGLAYDALKAAARLVAADEVEKKKWLDMASKLQKQTIETMWLDGQLYFAQGLDRSPDGATRTISTQTSNPGVLLNSDLLLDLPTDERQKYVEAIVKVIGSSSFMTPAGIRSRSLKHKQMPGFIDYHGSYTVWPKETYSIACGLRRHGLASQAKQLELLILNSVSQAGEFCEFFYVNDDGRVWYDKDKAIEHFSGLNKRDNLAVPEPGQAWTISAVLSILNRQTSLLRNDSAIIPQWPQTEPAQTAVPN